MSSVDYEIAVIADETDVRDCNRVHFINALDYEFPRGLFTQYLLTPPSVGCVLMLSQACTLVLAFESIVPSRVRF